MGRWRRDQDALAAVFARCRKQRRPAFVAYICAGDPHLAVTEQLIYALARGGADIIELGVPFSDPIADGPVNQRAAFRALRSGTTLSGILELAAKHRRPLGVPLVLFSYYNPIHRRGATRFAEQAADSGIDGVLCVDLPPEEGEEELVPALVQHGVAPIFLLAPTSTRDRVRRVARASRGFVYYVSRTGVTGERAALPRELVDDLKRLRRLVSLPLAVGFGISTRQQVAAVARHAEGVVVGSALVRVIEEHGEQPDLARRLEAKVRALGDGPTGRAG